MKKLTLAISKINCRNPSAVYDEYVPHDAAQDMDVQEETKHHLDHLKLGLELSCGVELWYQFRNSSESLDFQKAE